VTRQVGPVLSVTGGYVFTLHKDIVAGGGAPSMTLIYETSEEAAEARELVAKASSVAKSATGSASR